MDEAQREFLHDIEGPRVCLTGYPWDMCICCITVFRILPLNNSNKHPVSIQELKGVVRDKNFADDWKANEGKRNAARRAAMQQKVVQRPVDNPIQLLKDKLMAGAHGSGTLLQVIPSYWICYAVGSQLVELD